SGDAGAGGAISLTAGGNIATSDLLVSFSVSGSGDAGAGGAISLTAGGNIATSGDLDSFSVSVSGNAGAGGAISLTAGGNIATNGDLRSFSFSDSDLGDAGAGGNISLLAKDGFIHGINTQVVTLSVTEQGGTIGAGGMAMLQANAISGLEVITLSSEGQSGDVVIQGLGNNLVVSDLSLITSALVEITIPFFGPISVDTRDIGQSGNTSITSAGNLTLQDVVIQSDANGGNRAGEIIVNSPGEITLTNSEISVNTNAGGNAGIIVLNASSITVEQGTQISAVTNAGGKGGDITINTPTFTLSETARITATATETATNIEGGGSITLNASNMNLAGVVGVFAETEGQAPAGTLTLQPFDANFGQGASQFDPQLTLLLAPGAEISASTSGSGQGGGLQVFAPEAITIAGPGRLIVETLGPGDAGDIEIRTQRLTLTDGVEISASTLANSAIPSFTRSVEFVDSPPTFTFTEIDDAGQLLATSLVVSNQQGSPLESISGSLSEAGDVDLYQIYLSGDGAFSASTVNGAEFDTQLFLFSAPDGLGIYGNDDSVDLQSTLPAQNPLTPTDSGIYYLAVSGFEDDPLTELGEEIFDFRAIKAPTGPGGASSLAAWTGLSLESGGYTVSLTGVEVGPAELTAGFTRIEGEPVETEVNTVTGFLNPGDAGDINIFAEDVNLTNGATVQTNTSGIGNAGNIEFNVNNTLRLDQGTIAASTDDTATGRGGDIDINAGVTRLRNSSITVNSQGQGIGGDISIDSDVLTLEQGSEISAATASTDGGNIDLAIEDLLLLSDRSQINATAGTAAGGGDGGNIDIRTKFLVATPEGPNQIIAEAFDGDGGNINITATSLLGEAFLNISASSERGIDGPVQIDSPDIDPARGLTELPVNLTDTSNQIVNACAVGRQGQSQFVVTGRGGLPITPASQLTGTYLLPDLGALTSGQTDSINPPYIQEAQGWTVAANGDIVLTAKNFAGSHLLNPLLQEAAQAYHQADYAQAAALWTQAATALSQGNDPLTYASTLSNLALAYGQLGDWRQADVAILASQHLLTPENAPPQLLAQILNTRASLNFSRGQTQAAINDWRQAAESYRRAGDPLGQLQAQLNQAQTLQSLGFYHQAQVQLEDIAAALADQPPSPLKAMALMTLGNGLRNNGEAARAQQTLEAALALTQGLNQPALTSQILLNLGHAAQANPDQALAYYQNALAMAPAPLTQFQARISQLRLLATQNPVAAQRLWSDLEPTLQPARFPASRDAIYAQLHLAHTLLQHDLSLNSPETLLALLNQASQQAQSLQDPIAQAYILGYTGDLYGKAQQWTEAQAFTEEALRQAQTWQAPEMVYSFALQLGRLQKAQGNRSQAIDAYSAAIDALGALRTDLIAASDEAQFSFRDDVEPVYREVVKLLLQGEAGGAPEQANLKQARALIEDLQVAEINDYFQDACIQGSPFAADEVDPTAAVIYPILLDDRLDVIVSVAGQPARHYSTPVSPGQVEQTVKQLLGALTSPLRAGRAATTQQLQQVYDWILGPAAADLAQQDIESLVFVADGVLRTLPLTTLHDGEQYLIEKYNVVLSPGLTLLDPRPLQRRGLQMLAGGLSKARSGFPALHFVVDELQQVTAQIPDHQVLLNQELTKSNLLNSLEMTPAQVVHLATHGQFSSNAEDTFILTWEGKLTLKEMSSVLQTRNRSDISPIELLVFSACKTASGDSRAVLGIAGTAVRSGVRSTLAGLWAINDEAAAAYMAEFYKALAQPGATKAEAFRQAQLALMQDPRLASPYYWSPFVLVGNWQ
ncbi:MAG: CHAT domain-containing protein, partial [Leptolyngbyaceae cyanobacterium MO_188.B28]|nr:CHAT domain-containing protein [Leptolyngbyaceae cyanobacterium MO_188.B28]